MARILIKFYFINFEKLVFFLNLEMIVKGRERYFTLDC